MPIAKNVAGGERGVLFLWERLPERQRRPARGRQLPESTLKDAPPVLPGAIWQNSSKIADRVVLAETEKVLPREPRTAHERDNIQYVLTNKLQFIEKSRCQNCQRDFDCPFQMIFSP
ncbi:hypothetical protein SELR_22500 [Selenomonas ruminantium subsp. lactilytica TAM6421]|uniref:Uncharacterized protein n=1 Tax=Selenomonas ruminantium subsp. lactilytica (strain NBRC 103574 / TAM6421) TaxID=927704 RepID=I0GT71_SELRL|nr:hypothetical protein [Selenomonas ruminantium]BAL83958.1 hypothetical protein SELR_22500 [Selenomonas ruminantium subsp. lactilytica TAM6421]